jgi:hypothetical protein
MKEKIIYQCNKALAYLRLAKKKVINVFTNKEGLACGQVAPPPNKVTYARLCAIYEGDLKMESEQFISVFLLQFQDIDGHEYICPVYAEPNHREMVRTNLNRCKPVHMLFDQHKDGGVSFKDSVEVKHVGNNNVVDITASKNFH